MALPSLAHARARAAGNLTDIQYDSPLGIHYVEDPAYPGEPIVLYCMNNQRAWLHGMDGVNPPAYLQGYLTPDMFDSPQQYEECMGAFSATTVNGLTGRDIAVIPFRRASYSVCGIWRR